MDYKKEKWQSGAKGNPNGSETARHSFITDISNVITLSLGCSGMNTGAEIVSDGLKHRTRTEKRLWGRFAEMLVQNISGTTQYVT
ncbi:MAG: hypothetical protein WCR46_18740 [Deltaproteobacteria bacterium]